MTGAAAVRMIAAMNVSDAVRARRSVRAFLPDPVDPALVRRLAVEAARAPSNGNTQPWHVDLVFGAPLEEIRAQALAARAGGSPDEPAEYEVYPPKLWPPYRDRRFRVGEDLYARIGVAREDREGRLRWFGRNAELFGAPAAAFVTLDRRMGPGQWADVGMYLQTFMLLLEEAGLGTCAQGYWALHPSAPRRVLGIPDERMIYAGLAIGYPDPAHPLAGLETGRAAEDEFLRVHGA